MNKYTITTYFATDIRFGSYGVSLNPDEEKNPEGVKRAIDRHNSVLLGGDHDPQQFCIVRRTRTQYRNDADMLLSRSVFENTIEVYPPEPCSVPRYYLKPYDPKKHGFETLDSSFDPSLMIARCKRQRDTYVTDRSGKVIFSNK